MAPIPTLLSPAELSYLHTSLSLHLPIRPDARTPTSFRPLVAETDLLPSANGSARLCFADGTEAIVGVKAELGKRPDDARGDGGGGGGGGVLGGDEGEQGRRGNDGGEDDEDDGWVEVGIDMAGQREDDGMAVFLAQMIQEGLVADGGVRGRLGINGRWHWRLYIDILLLSPPHTYPLPLLSLTTHLALLSTRLPAPTSTDDEDPVFNDDWDAARPLYPPHPPSPDPSGRANAAPSAASRPPVTLLVISVGANIFFDASREELAVADAVLAVTVGASPTTDNDHHHRAGTLSVLAVRTIDPPSRLSAPAAEMGMVTGNEGEKEGGWKPRKGGVKRGVLRRMLESCVERGGVGEEVLGGLERFA